MLSRHVARKVAHGVPSADDKSRSSESLLPDPKVVRVVLTFAAIFAVSLSASWWLARQGVFDGVLVGMARFSAALDRAIGIDATVRLNEITVGERILRIDHECTGMSLMIVYASLVLAYPLGWGRRIVGLVAGLAVIQLANQLRLVAVAVLAKYAGDAVFQFTHDYLFMIAMAGVVIACWGVYLAKARSDASAS